MTDCFITRVTKSKVTLAMAAHAYGYAKVNSCERLPLAFCNKVSGGDCYCQQEWLTETIARGRVE